MPVKPPIPAPPRKISLHASASDVLSDIADWGLRPRFGDDVTTEARMNLIARCVRAVAKVLAGHLPPEVDLTWAAEGGSATERMSMSGPPPGRGPDPLCRTMDDAVRERVRGDDARRCAEEKRSEQVYEDFLKTVGRKK